MKSASIFKPILIYTTALSGLWSLSAIALSEYYQDVTVEIADNKKTERSKTGASVTLLDSQDINNNASFTAKDNLNLIPSAYVGSTGGAGQPANLSLRGLPAGQTKVLLNGISIADQSLIQPSYNFAYLPSSSLSRIEVVRGNQSTLHGSDAIGGVMNMQSFSDKQSQGAFATLGLMGGSYETGQVYAKGGYNTSRSGISFYGDYLQTEGISAAAEKNGNTEKDGYKNTTLGFNAWYDINAFLTLESGVHYMDSSADYDGSSYDATLGIFLPSDAQNFTSSDENTAYIRLLGQELWNGRLNTSLDISQREINRSYDAEAFGGGRSVSDYSSRQYGGKWKADYQINTAINTAFGAEYNYSQVDIKTAYSALDAHINESAIWNLTTITPIDNLAITLGARWQNHEIFGDEWTWRSTLSYLLESTQTRLHASAGSGFRAPSLYELLDPTYGNQKLKPEESLSYDLGLEQTFLDNRLTVDVTGFYNEIENKILYQSTGFYTGNYANISRERSMGVEASVKGRIWEKLDIAASYAYVKAWNPNSNEDSLRQPRHRGALSVTWQPYNKLKLGADVKAYSGQQDYYDGVNTVKLAGYGLLDLRAEYIISEPIKFKANIHNLLNKSYEPSFGYGSQGISAYIGLEANF